MRISDWSSDVCSSDLSGAPAPARRRSRTSAPGTSAPCRRPRCATGRSSPGSCACLAAAGQPARHRLGELGESAFEPADRLAAGHIGDRVVPPQNKRGERSAEQTSELQSLKRSSYAVFCLNKTKQNNKKQ